MVALLTRRLNFVIDEMPNWKAGMLAKRKVDCALTLVLTFNQQNLVVQSGTEQDSNKTTQAFSNSGNRT